MDRAEYSKWVEFHLKTPKLLVWFLLQYKRLVIEVLVQEDFKSGMKNILGRKQYHPAVNVSKHTCQELHKAKLNQICSEIETNIKHKARENGDTCWPPQ